MSEEHPTDPFYEEPRPARGPTASGATTRVIVTLVLIGVLVGAGAGVFGLLKSLRKAPGRAATPPPRTAVSVRPAARSSYVETLTGYGRARALRRTRVAAEVTATVAWIDPALESGHAVEPGTVLVRLDDRDARTALAGAEARLARAQAEVRRAEIDLKSLGEQLEVARGELASAERELERERTLFDEGHTTASAVDGRSMQAATRHAAVVALEGRLAGGDAAVAAARAAALDAQALRRRAEDDLARTEIAAPFQGVVERRMVELGARVAPGSELFEVVDVSRVEIAVGLPASRFDVVRPGAAVRVLPREGAAPVWTGTLARTSPTVDTENRTFSAYVLIDGGDETAPVPPGSFVVVEVTGERYDDVIVVPRNAFVGTTLFVAQPDGEHEAVVHALTPGLRATLLDVVLVESGVEPGALIVTSNVEQIADGSRVRRVLEEDRAQ